MMSLGIGVARSARVPLRTRLAALFAAWWQRVQSRYEVARLSERELADMRLTRLDIVQETHKPFWEA
jgi:uncharacterized protein YjiS (DUF1127 family)